MANGEERRKGFDTTILLYVGIVVAFCCLLYVAYLRGLLPFFPGGGGGYPTYPTTPPYYTPPATYTPPPSGNVSYVGAIFEAARGSLMKP